MPRTTIARAAVAVAVLGVMAWIAVRIAAEITVMRAFYDALGFGDVYGSRLRWNVWLAVAGLAGAVLLVLPVLALGRRVREEDAEAVEEPEALAPPTDDEIARMAAALDPADLFRQRPSRRGAHRRSRVARRITTVGALTGFVVLAGALIPGAVGLAEPLRAARAAVPFGVEDPVFGHDVAFSVFTVPAVARVLQVVGVGLFLALCVLVLAAVALWYGQVQAGARGAAAVYRERGLGWSLLLGGALMVCLGAGLWLSRYGLVSTAESELVAGAGRAVRHIDIPTRAVAGATTVLLGLFFMLMSVPGLRRVWMPARVGPAAVWGLAVWGGVAAVLTLLASAWWAVMLLVVVIAGALLHRGLSPARAEAALPVWTVPAFAATTVVAFGIMGPFGAALYDAVVLRGPQYQVERQAIDDTWRMTRAASGLDAARVRQVPAPKAGLSAADVTGAQDTVASLRVLDIPTALRSCQVAQVVGDAAAYACDDIDINRMPLDGRVRTVAIGAREVAASERRDFQSAHLTLTHGYGILATPVDRFPVTGNVSWPVGGVPQRGIEPALTHPQIYFGAAPAPWVIANSDQPVVDAGRAGARVTDWCTGPNAAFCGRDGGTGIAMDSTWRRLAAAIHLGGQPFLGDGRRFLSAAVPGTRLLLERDLTARVRELAPFLELDSDPYFAPAGGRLWVVAPAYVRTDRYPYATELGGTNYVRQPVVVAMDAYSGRTHLFVMDPDEPMLATWRAVYPDLFTPMRHMDAVAPGLRAQVRYGEDMFAFQSAIAEVFHVGRPADLVSGGARWVTGVQVGDQGPRNSTGGGGWVRSEPRYAVVRDDAGRAGFAALRTFTAPPLTADAPRQEMNAVLEASSEPTSFGRLTLTTFTQERPLSLYGAGSRIRQSDSAGADSLLVSTRSSYGETMVVPVNGRLLYAMPIYMGEEGARTLSRVMASDGRRVVLGRDLNDALGQLVQGDVPSTGADDPAAPPGRRLAQAREAARAYREALAAGDYDAAGRHWARLMRLLDDPGAASAP